MMSGPEDFLETETHDGNIVLSGTQVMLIENKNYLQKGNIYIKDNAKLIITKSNLSIDRGNVPTIHVYIFGEEGASLDIDESQIFPQKVTYEEELEGIS